MASRAARTVLQSTLQRVNVPSFIGDADGTTARWRVFVAWLESLARTSSATAGIIASARATFLAFARWVESHAEARHGERD